jgi:hypothetical protein
MQWHFTYRPKIAREYSRVNPKLRYFSHVFQFCYS